MQITTGNKNAVNNMINMYTAYSNSDNANSVGFNGIIGFQNWECYMLLKYGHNGDFSVSGQSQYLIELPIYPEQVTESISAGWSTQKVLGRSSPVAAYANTDLKTVNFNMDLHRDFLTGSFSLDCNSAKALGYKGGGKDVNDKSQLAGYQQQSAGGPFGTRTWYTNINKMLQMSCYPQYTSKGLIPPTTYFIFGQMILKGFVTAYQTEWKKPILNSFYGWNSVSITMDCYPDTIISANEMIERSDTDNRGNASTQNTYNTVFPSKIAEGSNVMTRRATNDRVNARGANSLGGSIRTT